VWFKEFSKGLGSERQWVKFSYLWIASQDFPAPVPAAGLRRVISDRLGADHKATGKGEVLICEPEHTGKFALPAGKSLWRGDLVNLSEGGRKPIKRS
jgi:hypothetical protein